MKIFSLLLALLSFNVHAITIQCTSEDGNPKNGFVKGDLTERKGSLQIGGDEIFFNTYERDTVEFNRQIRPNEESFSFAKFSGSGNSLFHFYYLSVPKQLFTSPRPQFSAFLSYLREGVGGMGEVKLTCQTFPKNLYMQNLISRYTNIMTYDRLSEADLKNVMPITQYNELPKLVQDTLKQLKLAIVIEWDYQLAGDSFLMINFSKDAYENDALVVTDQGQTVGYAFNVTECNPEECYGWDALYVDVAGNILFKSF